MQGIEPGAENDVLIERVTSKAVFRIPRSDRHAGASLAVDIAQKPGFTGGGHVPPFRPHHDQGQRVIEYPRRFVLEAVPATCHRCHHRRPTV